MLGRGGEDASTNALEDPTRPTRYAAERPTMLNADLKDVVLSRILPNVKTPAQYLGGELNSVAKDHRQVRGTLCLAFPDTYALGMSHHGLQVLYSLMNADPQWACERAFTPLARLRGRAARARAAALRPGDVHAAARVRRHRLPPPVRGLLHERADDARPRRHPAARQGPRRSTTRWSSPAARGRRTRSCSPRSSTCSSSATARRACRSSARCGWRCRATRRCRAPTCWRGSPASVDLGLRPRVLRAGVPRRRHASPP